MWCKLWLKMLISQKHIVGYVYREYHQLPEYTATHHTYSSPLFCGQDPSRVFLEPTISYSILGLDTQTRQTQCGAQGRAGRETERALTS